MARLIQRNGAGRKFTAFAKATPEEREFSYQITGGSLLQDLVSSVAGFTQSLPGKLVSLALPAPITTGLQAITRVVAPSVLRPQLAPREQEDDVSLIGNGNGWSSVLSTGISTLGSIYAARQQAKVMSSMPMASGILPGAGAAIGVLGRSIGSAASRMLPALPGAGAVVRGGIAAGRGLASAAQRWCARNPKACGALGGAGIVAEMMRTGELKRPGRRMNPMNVRAMRRAIRRVKAGRKIARQIESLLPRRAGSSVVHATPSRLFHAKK